MITTQGKSVLKVLIEVVTAAIDQGGRCVSGGPNSICLYGNGKSHCFIGWMLPEESKLMGYEGSLMGLLSKYSMDELGENSGFIVKHQNLLNKFQSVHDRDFVDDNCYTNNYISGNFLCSLKTYAKVTSTELGSLAEYVELEEILNKWENLVSKPTT